MEKIYGEKGIVLPENLEIPKIDNQKLLTLYRILKPIVTVEDMKYLLREYTIGELRYRSYIWTIKEDKTEEINPSSLEMVEDFPCLHAYNERGIFKPSVAEILAQIPIESIREADVFEIIEKPETWSDIVRYPEVTGSGYHLSKVRSYKLHR